MQYTYYVNIIIKICIKTYGSELRGQARYVGCINVCCIHEQLECSPRPYYKIIMRKGCAWALLK